MKKFLILPIILCLLGVTSPSYGEPISSRITKPHLNPILTASKANVSITSTPEAKTPPAPIVAPKTATIKPPLIVVNQSQYIDRVSYTTLYDYLDIVAESYPIYQGTYRIYLVDQLPSSITFPPRSLGGHIAGAIAYINVKGMIQAGYDPYIAITHELAEMATDRSF